ncbi:MAG: flagellar basal body-associated FliL family protein [Bdellovibrionota bacterium]
MAEEKAAAAQADAAHAAPGGQKPILFIILAIINMVVVAGVGFMVYKAKKDDAANPKMEHVHNGEAAATGEHGEAAATGEHGGAKSDVPKVVPLETFIVNLAGSKGRRVARVNMELEVKDEGGTVADEIDKRKAQIRDIIIIILSSKSFDEVSNPDGKANLKNEVKDTLNSFLTKGKVTNVFFSDFIYN